MWLDPRYHLGEILMGHLSFDRPLDHVLIERHGDDPLRGIAVASDGIMLAVVPCTLYEGDVPGLLPVRSVADPE